MAISDSVQTLTAAFSFGILLEAASGGFLIYYKGHGSTILQDGRRLVLVLFLLFAALWAQIDFINLMLPNTSPTACQALLVFSTMFDQLARVGIEQFLLWSVRHQGTKVTAGGWILQGILVVRLVAGGVLVSFTRPQFAPACVARTSVLPASIVVLALDVIIIGVLIIRAVSLGVFGGQRGNESDSIQDQSRALALSIGGFTVWTATSVTMILGLPAVLLILRTTLPANGLLVLVGIVTLFSGPLLLPREEQRVTPEARSPFAAPMPPSREILRDNVASGSPLSGNNYTKNGHLFVVNPSTPGDSPTPNFQANYHRDTRGFIKLSEDGQDQSTTNHAPGYRGSSGVFPSIMAIPLIGGNQVASSPQIRIEAMERTRDLSNAVFRPAAIPEQKKSLFNRSKPPPKASIRTLGISKPVMTDNEGSSPQPFIRIPTIDLATAAVNERERREGVSAKSRLIANRPAPPIPSLPAQEGLRRSISTRRKAMPNYAVEAMPTIQASITSSLSVGDGNSTSASLSPGREEVRRRSPRNANSFDVLIDEKPISKPGLQRKPTIGLPSNPRSQRAATTRQGDVDKEQTAMFMNNIVYDDPGMVKTIIRQAPAMYASVKRPKTSDDSFTSQTTELKSSDSIIHRPRPYRRDTEKDRALFPSEPSHKRSKSGSSIITRKSILMSHPGSPTQLPPLPPPPRSASELRRLLPNDTKSMTFDEKIQLLFPAPPSLNFVPNRRSSVPSLPRVPSVFMSETIPARSPTEEERKSSRTSKRTTIASFGMADAITRDDSPKRDASRAEERQTYRFSANTYRTLADEVGETWIPGIPSKDVDVRNSIHEETKPESVHDMRTSILTEATSSEASSQDDATSYWGSVHSKAPPLDIAKARRNARSTFIQRLDYKFKGETSKAVPPVPEPESEVGEEVMTIMLDTEETRSEISWSNSNRKPFLLDTDQALPGDKTPSPRWHRRIGDQLPTFSERTANTPRARKMPPPTPLLLNRNGRQATVVVRASEPSPVESPERAIEEIQAQLKRFEEPNRGSVGSLLCRMPEATSGGAGDAINDRLRLLENIEKEMGQQENQWQQMQSNLDRNSMSTIATPLPEAPSPSVADLSRESSGASQRQSRIDSRRARIRSSMTMRSKGEDSTCTTSTQSSDNSRASVWQQRLAEAQMEYLENAPALPQNRSMNFLSISKAQLGSPTPPDSLDSQSDPGTELEPDSDSENPHSLKSENNKELVSLWQLPLGWPKAAVGRMWNPPYESPKTRAISPEPPAKDVRPKPRLTQRNLTISSCRLWSKPFSSQSRPVVGLWGSKVMRPKSIITRPTAQKPLRRKSRRVTFLPDIVESPLPLPNKRDTLGIFQFPWGETSDQPYQPVVYPGMLNPAFVAGPAISANLDARSRQLEPEISEYSSSFFDDYDEEDEFEIDDYDGESDDFDESTLFEIAELLNSRDVPSKKSLLPTAREIIEDYDDEETDFESGSDQDFDSPKNATPPPIKLPIQPLAMTLKETTFLCNGGLKPTIKQFSTGLPQPESSMWWSLARSADDVIRSRPRTSGPASDNSPVLTSHALWTAPEQEIISSVVSALWSSKEVAKSSSSPTLTSSTSFGSLLWERQLPKCEPQHTGLLSVDSERSIFRVTQELPAAIKMPKAVRAASTTIPSISSQSLWSPDRNIEEMTPWISKSIVSSKVPNFISSSQMWTPVPNKPVVEVFGLFNVSTSRSDYRTTSSAPAGINMARKPRFAEASLGQLTSDKLWNGLDELPSERDWISESSVRPQTPSLYSPASSGRSSPSSDVSSDVASDDASSVKTTSTKASSLWGSIGSAVKSAKPAWWDSRAKLNKSSEKSTPPSLVEDVKPTSKIPVRQTSKKPLKTLRESRVLASRDLWEAKSLALDNTPVKKLRRSIVSEQPDTPVYKPLRHQHRPTLLVRANWDEALAEAIAAGRPKVKRPMATMADWNAALALAIALSKPRRTHLVASPETWEAALAEAISQGIVPGSARRNHVVVPHPTVFFTDPFASSSVEVEPVALGRAEGVTLVNDFGLWSPSPTATTPSAPAQRDFLWSKEAVPKRQVVRRSPSPGTVDVRKPLPTSNLELDILESTSLWQRTPAPLITERNWLSTTTTSRPSVQTWTPRAFLPVTPAPQAENSGLWTPMTTVPVRTEPDMFADNQRPHLKIAIRSTTLPKLSSNELFIATPNLKSSAETEKHWLHSTSSTTLLRPSLASKSFTWTAPTPKLSPTVIASELSTMWLRAASEPQVEARTLFTNPHTEPWSRPKRGTEDEKRIESSKLWRSSRETSQSPRDWLTQRNARVSRVQFRY